jgi:hypothetical protein
MKKHTSISIPDTIEFSDLKLARDKDGMVSFDVETINKICNASGIDVAIFTQESEDNVSALIVAWYKSHITNGDHPDIVAEDLISEVRLEDSLGGGVSHQPGNA